MPLRILLLEDDQSHIVLSTRLLAEIGTVHWVDTKEAFLHFLSGPGNPDIIVADARLPGFTGEEAFRLVQEKCPHIPFVLLTGTLNDERCAALMREGLADYILKDRMSRLPDAVRHAVEWKQGQLERFRAQRMENIGVLAAGIVHDLNNILAPCVMITGMPTLRNQLDETGCKLLDKIEESVRRGGDLIRQVIMFIRGQNGHGEQKELNIVDVVMEALRWLEFYKGVEIRRMFATDTPKIHGNLTQLFQVFTNLFVNARQAVQGQGTIFVAIDTVELRDRQLRTATEPVSGRFIRVAVSDDGIGITPDGMTHLFERFFTTKTDGTGMGLPIAAEIVRGHRGYMDVQSVGAGQGATFTVYLPVGDISGEFKSLNGKGETILLTEDEAILAEVNKMTMELYGYHVLVARNGAEALSIFVREGENIDVVVTDAMMPVMDGKVLIAKLREIRSDVKVIGITGAATEEGADLDAAKILKKPYNVGELLTALRDVLKTPNTA